MSPDNEPRIERYVRRPDAMEADERRAVERLLKEDAGAAAYAEFLRGFYERLDADAGRPSADRVEAFVDDLFGAASVIPVRPFQSSREARPTVLAAETATPSDERRFSVLTTLAAEADQVLVRVVADRETHRGRLYVLADPPDRRAHVVVSFPDLGLDLVADEEGRRAFDLPPEIDADQWTDARALVRRPVATGRVAPAASTTVELPSGGTLQCRREDGTLTAWLEEGEAGSPSMMAATRPGATPHLLRLQSASPRQCTVDGEEPLTLRLYE